MKTTRKQKQARKLTPAQTEAAQRHDAALRAIGRHETIGKAEAATRLFAIKREKLYRALGHSCVEDYAFKTLGYSPGLTRDLIKLEQRLAKLPKIAAAFRSGEISWTKARDAARGAEATAGQEGGDEDGWLARAKKKSSHDVEREAAEATGEPKKRRLVVELPETTYADVEDTINALRRELGEGISKADAIAEICRRAREGGKVGRPEYRIAISVCSECGKPERRTSAGKIVIPPEELALAARSAEFLDITKGPTKELSRKIPASILRYVVGRDGDGCVFPGCPNRGFLEAHHEGGFAKVGHDETKIYHFCTQHHRDMHALQIVAVLEGSGLQFALADGTCAGDGRRGRARREEAEGTLT